jgi:hypothetical protein
LDEKGDSKPVFMLPLPRASLASSPINTQGADKEVGAIGTADPLDDLEWSCTESRQRPSAHLDRVGGRSRGESGVGACHDPHRSTDRLRWILGPIAMFCQP